MPHLTVILVRNLSQLYVVVDVVVVVVVFYFSNVPCRSCFMSVICVLQRKRSVTWGVNWKSMAFRCQLSVKLEVSWPMSCRLMKLPVSDLLTLWSFNHSVVFDWSKRSYLIWYVISSTKSMFCFFSLVHAAVIAINEAVDRGQASVTMGALNNPNAMLRNTQEPLAQEYQDTLSQTKSRKRDQSSGRVRRQTLQWSLGAFSFLFSILAAGLALH